VIESESKVRVKLGLIAVAEKLMTEKQADEVNKLQAIMDRRFGDIAVEKGYLTEDQVSNLLKKQGNIYMVFVQTLIDKGLMTLEEIDASLGSYQEQQGFTHSDMDALVSGDVDRTVQLFLPSNTELCDRYCGVAIRTFLRVIDSSAYVSKAYFTDELLADNFAMQVLDGDHKIQSGFAGKENALLTVAVPFADEQFETVDLDALDAVGEFTNCVNGIFASELSTEGVDVDMLPPAFYDKPVKLSGNQFCVFPIHVGGQQIQFVLSIDSELSVN
jgi:hypothetical protein